jgi:thiamine pyrophosphokinase
MVFLGGDNGTTPPLDPGAYVVACDSGYDHATARSHHVDLLVGDLDSISQEGLAEAESHGVEIERHPQDKDETDFELAIAACVRHGVTRIDVYGGEGGRLDHLLAIATALTADRWRDLSLKWHTSHEVVVPLTGPAEIALVPTHGSRVSLIAVTDCKGVSTTGLAWKLDDETLPRGSSRGISNIAEGTAATVSVAFGSLLITESTNQSDHASKGPTNQ